MWVEWTEDYGQYKKGDAFEVTGPSLEELLNTGKVKKASKTNIKEAEAQQDENAALLEVNNETAVTKKK